MLKRLVFSFLGLACALQAAYLEVYRDQSRYHYRPESTYIGFADGMQAMDGNGALMLRSEATCEEAHEVCKEFMRLEALIRREVLLQEEYATLETLLGVQRLQNAIDAKTLISQASEIGRHKAQIASELTALREQIVQAGAQFQKQSTSDKGHFFSTLPKGEVELVIGKGLDFESVYLLDLDARTLFHDLLLTNRSGVDIIVDEVRLYDRAAGAVRAPIAFSPRPIGIGAPQQLMRANKVMLMEAAPAPAAAMAQIAQEKLRQYRLGKTVLHTDGVAQRFEVEQMQLEPVQGLRWDAYNDSAVYETVSLELPKPIESDTIKVREGGRLIEHARMLREEGGLRINTAIAYEIEAQRKALVDYAQEKGLFGGDLQKEEGIELRLHNRDSKRRSVLVVERIPVSTDERIRVTVHPPMLEETALPYRYDERTGKLEFDVALDAAQHSKVLIKYTIRYPKEMTIYY